MNNPFHILLFKRYSIVLFLFISFISCKQSSNKDALREKTEYQHAIRSIEILYARGFTISQYNNFKLIEVTNPWQGAKDIKFQYILYTTDLPPQHNYNDAIEIKIPIRKIVCLSTTHIGFVEKLQELETIVGVANNELVYNRSIRNRIDQGLIIDVGYEQSLNNELLMQINPDIIMAYGVNSEITGVKNKLNELGLKTILNAEYLESTPLGKAEWIKFMAAFYLKDDLADSIFAQTETEYIRLSKLVKNEDVKPNILTGLPWKGTWHIPGSNSYAAHLIIDAGGNFLWNNNSHEAIGMNIESVFEIGHNCDIWINPGAALFINDIISCDERLTKYSACKQNKVFNNNNRINKFGGNDYWESGIVNPNIILKDLIAIFHPEILPNYSLFYYRKLDFKF